MKAFEVWINGEKKCTAGVGDDALLSAGLTWTRSGSHLHVGGLEHEEHLRWLEPSETELKVGDEVVFRLIETETIDEPRERTRGRTRAQVEAKVREHLAQARRLLVFLVDDNDAAFGAFEKHLEQGHLIGAIDALGALGETRSVPADFWRELASACHGLTQYEDRNRYSKNFQSAKHLESSTNK